MIDANFRAKLKDRSLDDIKLAPGWSYFVEETQYMAHVNAQNTQSEVSSKLVLMYILI